MTWASAMETSEIEGRTFMESICEKYSPENFPCRRGPGLGVVVVPSGQQGSPMKGEDSIQRLNSFLKGCFGNCMLLLCFMVQWLCGHYPLDRLNLPSLLVLNGSGISHAGDEGEIAAFCAHVIELDLSHNKLQDWHEVSL